MAIPQGNVGNLTTEQEVKLRQFWGTIFKLIDLYDSKDPEIQAALNSCVEQASAPSPKSRFGFFSGANKPSTENAKATALIEQQLHLGAADQNDKYGLRKKFMDIIGKHSAETVRNVFTEAFKMDHPDALVLRFLRARKWEVDKGFVMMFSALEWRSATFKVDSDIMLRGEGGAAADEKDADPKVQGLGHDFIQQLRMGKCFIHGTDRDGRPISYIRARLHKSSEFKPEALERFIVYNIETGRYCLNPPLETACLVFDLSGFTLANLDYTPIKFIIQSFEANYPESLGVILVHNAPWVFKSVWGVIHSWLDPVVASKVHFTYGRDGKDGITKFIAPEALIKELDGDEEWEYKYEEPLEGENDVMKDTTTRERLETQRQEIVSKFETVTRRWVESGSAEDAAERNRLAKDCTDVFWKLDPYIRARSLYDRQGNINGGKFVTWSAEEKAAAAAAADDADKSPEGTVVDADNDADLANATKAVKSLEIEEKTPLTVTSNAVAA